MKRFLLFIALMTGMCLPGVHARITVIRIVKDNDKYRDGYMLLNPADTVYVDTVFTHMDMGIMLPDGFDLKKNAPDSYYELYVNGKLLKAGEIRNGKRYGRWTAWYGNGKVCERWQEYDGKRTGYATTYEEGRLASFTYYIDGQVLIAEYLRKDKAIGRTILFYAKTESFDESFALKRTQAKSEIWEEHNYQDSAGKTWYWMPKEGEEMTLQKEKGRTVSWRYHNTQTNEVVAERSPALTEAVPAQQKLIVADTGTAGYVCELAEVPATYPGGEKALQLFFEHNLEYPKDALANGIEGKVYVSFSVDTKGAITNAAIAKGLYPSCDKEALRLVALLGSFAPGQVNGKNAACRMVLPVVFRMK